MQENTKSQISKHGDMGVEIWIARQKLSFIAFCFLGFVFFLSSDFCEAEISWEMVIFLNSW